MIRNIIKYVGIVLVILGIFLVFRNLVSKDTNWNTNNKKNNKNITYNVTIKLLDKDSKRYLSDSKLVLKNEQGELVKEWTTTVGEYKVENLKKGKYTLVQLSAPSNYHLNKDNVTFEITNGDKAIVMYNTKMTEEEIKEANTSKSEVGVDNTASNKNIMVSIIGLLMTLAGISSIYKQRKNY